MAYAEFPVVHDEPWDAPPDAARWIRVLAGLVLVLAAAFRAGEQLSRDSDGLV